MSGYGYPHNAPGYGYVGAPPTSQPYGQPPSSQPPYGQPPSSQPPYGQPHSSSQPPYGQPYGQAPTAPAYGAPPYGAEGGKPPKENKPSYGSAPYYGGEGGKPPKENYGHGHGYGAPPSAPYPAAGSPFAAVLPSSFPPGTDPSIVACFQLADQDGSGLIDDKELQRALSSYNQSFSLRTVHLLMYLFTDSNSRRIGPKEFISLYYSLQSWREIFERFDRDRSGKIDTSELREALYSLGFSVSPVVLELLVAKFDKTGGHSKAIEYDNFIECCLTVKGLTEKFKAKDKAYTGSATFTYEEFMLTVLPFLNA